MGTLHFSKLKHLLVTAITDFIYLFLRWKNTTIRA